MGILFELVSYKLLNVKCPKEKISCKIHTFNLTVSFKITEWLPVIASALACSSLGTLLCMQQKQRFIPFCITILCLNIIVGSAGFFLHLAADLQVPATQSTDKLLYGAPLFAPLLFPNLSLLALLGIWKL